MIYTSLGDDLVFPDFSSVTSKSDALLFLQLLGDKSQLDHQLAGNPNYDWLDSEGGLSLLNGFGNYAVLDGPTSNVIATSRSLLFQNADVLNIKVDETTVDLIFDPTVAQSIEIDLASGAVANLHAATQVVFDVENLSDDVTTIFRVGEAQIQITGDGLASLTDLAADTLIDTIFAPAEQVVENAADTLLADASDVAADSEVTSQASDADLGASSMSMLSDPIYPQSEDLLIDYESILTQAKVSADLGSYLSSSLDDGSNILSLPFENYAVTETAQIFDAQSNDVELLSTDLVDNLTTFSDTTDLIFDDGLDIYFGI
ncbi:hypothetical protein [Marinobacterium sp. xm-d-530]|uniref:hypothetical protein n=1 Tax=Marinobacterium sp. xm-d-530 TaxID=2497747 RepID=UPI001568DFDF|nr:hypothetical protein [Marinobacterium sp. xm-d-530]NRQ01168.1 hypothetical protein [Marinobacterium sp. xm-d-530]